MLARLSQLGYSIAKVAVGAGNAAAHSLLCHGLALGLESAKPLLNLGWILVVAGLLRAHIA